MAHQDYIPDPDTNFVSWLTNYKTQVAGQAATFGLTAGEVTAVEADLTLIQGKINTLVQKKAEQQAATADKQTSRKAVEGRARALANRIKTHPSYTAALGQQLCIFGPEDTTDLTTAKPTLRANSSNAGSVTIGFNKSSSSGIRLESKRGSETLFVFQAVDTNSPYMDARANLTLGTPETRQYRAQYLTGDDTIGELSDVLTITVPG